MKGMAAKIKKGLFIFLVSFAVISGGSSAEAFTKQIIQRGAVGDDVIELQARLQNIGYYKGRIDGVFGWSTYWALRNFQEAYGLPIDGLAGTTTKNKLADASNFNRAFVHEQIRKGNEFTYYGGTPIEKQIKTKRGTAKKPAAKSPGKKVNTAATNSPAGFSQNEIQLLANAVYGEARGEPYIGQVAVAAVILNRLESPVFPHSISGVIFEPGAFTAVADGQIWLTPNERAKEAVIDAINGWDPTGNALYYFNPETATSKWIWTRPQIKQIGKHIFCE
ncbi:N-acetylmuramoyl-L-alanine amidase [Peribacillus deserti]|uniref:Spore cortex-lytic enzyme n=2 Tax=Peribacillus deserti TaxID=673318 RepID=A0ABS2QK56_9BACI|nr:N-acetylmuramoyl-L-alanine amidase [Peribacillus deserti]